MMPLVKVKPLADFPPGSVEEAAAGEAFYAICNVDGALHCVEGTCPHAGGPLGQGNLHGNYLVCPWHGWEFDTRTGLNDSDEDVKLATFPVVVQDGVIHIDVP
jgi:nitrite reductase/ring-hydroxylating ferredoxin subunit